MILTAAQMNKRIENEYRAMCAFPINNLFSWKVLPGQSPPRVRSYLVTYNVRTTIKVGGRERFQDKTVVRIDYPSDINAAPTVCVVEGKVPYLPNWWESGRMCPGDMWAKRPRLWEFVICIGHVLARDPDYTNPHSPANHEAANDWLEKERKGLIHKLYPCGRTDFPHPIGY